MIKIGIDARTYFFRSGLGRYCRNILALLLTERDKYKYCLWISNQKCIRDFPLSIGDGLDIRVSKAPFGSLDSENNILSREVNESGVDVFFSPYSPPPTAIRAPRVFTVHDLTAIRFPEMHLESTVSYLKASLEESLKTADAIIADSENTARDIQEFFPDSTTPVSVVPLGVEDRFIPVISPALISEILGNYGLKKNEYILYVGNLETRKNLFRVVKAYERSLLFGRVPLLLAGSPRWGSEDLLEYLGQNDLSAWVRLMDYVSDEDLPALYQGALFFVYVSLYEGFGLPVLEAMASGTPALISNTSSLPEIAGEAALLVNPLSVHEIQSGMERLYGDMSLRGILSNAGLLRSQKYTWMKTVRKLRNVLIDSAMRNR